ncbi:class I SAM-dependent methyltransferase [Caldimonas brevitalea]|uniref:Tellurite resistance protein TehB n=1 Tax=Caldimonas brevitalea TaxID=413882 RepID=A0A0G3BE37_9BURK|nr:class I SAM-dependent methyltransferase [Caldimonas brevitalea]AKJ27562.1 tellurite resistance protein TehB [Caldimonas brevitalea]
MTHDTTFYDSLTPYYHLIHQDWNASIERQGEQLGSLIDSRWPGGRKVLDVSCGIGTQALALARRGYQVVASDLSPREVERARAEAQARGLSIPFSVADMRQAHAHHGSGFDVVVCADNSLPHLLTDAEILLALQQMHACLRPGGGCLITVRDYDAEPRGVNIVKPYGVRVEGERRYLLFQVWDFDGAYCDITFFFVEEDTRTQAVQTHAMRSRYYAISTGRLEQLMVEAGFEQVVRLDGVFYQPVLIGRCNGLSPMDRQAA